MSTGFVWHELFMWHSTGNSAGLHQPSRSVQPGIPFEEPETKRRFKNLLDASGISDQIYRIIPRELTAHELKTIHTPQYIQKLKAMSESGGGYLTPDTPLGSGGYEIAALSAGGVVEAVCRVLEGDVKNAYALVRPPGHHAEADAGMGFCLFSNAALAAQYAIDHYHLERIAIVDWDVHHGNGAQKIFWNRADVLTLSIHQQGNYPLDSGGFDERGADEGFGYNINIPMLPGSGHGAYVEAMEKIIIPALTRYKPQLIIVPCGFDAGANDQLGRMMLHSDSYRFLTQSIMDVAQEQCHGRLVMCHEGGYEPNSVPYYGLAVIETLSGIKTKIDDPNLNDMKALFGQELQEYQHQHIQQVLQGVFE